MNAIRRIDLKIKFEQLDKDLLKRHEQYLEELKAKGFDLNEDSETVLKRLNEKYPVEGIEDIELIGKNIEKQMEEMDMREAQARDAVKHMQKELSDYKETCLKELGFFGRIEFKIRFWLHFRDSLSL